MKTLLFPILLFFFLNLPAYSETDSEFFECLISNFEGHPPRIAVRQKSGTYETVDLVKPGVVHVATSAVLPQPAVDTAIFKTPMLLPEFGNDVHAFPKVDRTADGKMLTQDIGVRVAREDLGVEISDSKGVPVVRIHPVNLKSAWKGLEIQTDATQVYGLGEYPRGARTDEPWLGWDARTNGEHGNIMSPFYGGVQTYTQFPIAYGVRKDGSAFGIFVDTPYKIDWDFKNPGKWKVNTWGDELRYVVFTGKDLREVHGKYLSMIGKSPVPPRGVLGNGISKFGYHNWDEVDQDITEMHKNGMPVGMVSLDLYWFGGDFLQFPNGMNRKHTLMGSLLPDPHSFPDFAQKVASLKKQGTDVMLISESYVDSGLPESQKLLDWGCIVKDGSGNPIVFNDKWWGTGYMVDWTNPASKEWVKLKYLPLAKMGVRNFWFDLGEPEAGLYAPNGRYFGIEPGKNDHGDIHNVYNLMWVKRFNEVMDQEMPNDRFYIMNRSGTSGLNRFGAGKWGGDAGMSVVEGQSGSSLREGDIPELVAHLQSRIKGMPLVGVDYYTSDVGGFHRWALHGDQRLRDQGYTIWYANSALLDMPFRPHLWIKDGETHYLPTNTGHVESNIANTRLRAELEPYYYQAAHRASEDGTPIIAPLFYYHPQDPVVREMGHEAYIGQDLLMGVVANIHETNRNVYLPQGGWYDFHSNQYIPASGDKSRWLNNVPVWREGKMTLPLFAREGAIVPMNRVTADGIRIGGDRELRVRAFGGSEPTQTQITEDDGVSRAYQKGEVQSTRVEQKKISQGYEVTINPSTGSYSGAPSSRAQRVELVIPQGRVVKVSRNGDEIKTVTNPAELNGDRPVVYLDDSKKMATVYSPALGNDKVIYSFSTEPEYAPH